MNSDETAPTTAILAALLGQGQQQRVPPLVLLKAGSESPPIFMAHGLGGTVMGLLQLARHMRVSRPIYGMQAKGLNGLDQPLDRIEDMAEFHLEAIRQLQPHGPYVLIGYSLGGLVTLEMARRLTGDGETIALLAMLDSYPDRHQLSVGQRVRLNWRLAVQRVALLTRVGGHSVRPAIDQKVSNTAHCLEPDGPIAPALQRVKDAQYRALRDYRPSFYNGKVKFVRAAIRSYFPTDPGPVWAHLVSELEVETVPGIHVEMLTTHVETLASVAGRYVEEAMDAAVPRKSH